MNIDYKPNRLLAQQPLALEAMFCIALMPSLWPASAAAQDNAHTHHGMREAASTPASPAMPTGMADMPGMNHGGMLPGHTQHGSTPSGAPVAMPGSAPPPESASDTPSAAAAPAAPNRAPAPAMPDMHHAASPWVSSNRLSAAASGRDHR